MIILTGASGGIGQAIRPLLRAANIGNDSIIPIYNRNKGNIEFGEQLDLSNIEEIKRFAGLIDAFSNTPLKITLIHLAAQKIDELAVVVDEKNWDKVIDVNLKGAFFLTKALLPTMMKEKWGRIIHIISSGLGDVGTLTYSTSKFGLLGMSEVLAREYARYGITSNVLQLGYFEIGMWNKLKDDKKIELLEQIPSKQLGDMQNIVNAVKFIIDSPFVSGAVINVDGGI